MLDLRSTNGLRASIVTLSDDFAGLRFKNNIGRYFMGVNSFSNRFVVYDNIANKERFTINSQGFMGVNEINPTSVLHVNGGFILSESDELEEQVLIGTNVLNNEAKVFIQNAGYPHALKIKGNRSTSGTAVVVEGNTILEGNLTIMGSVAKGSGTFKIDHPLDPENKYLYHSFVESPDMMNVYNGNATTDAEGNATITLPDYFEALNMDYRYQLMPIGQFAQAIIV